MKLLGLLFKLLAGLLLMALVGLVVFAALFDPNDYRDRVAELVRGQTGRELVLAGPLELSVFPWLAVEATDVSLGNAPGFAKQPMLTVSHISVGLRLLPLLSGELRLGEARLDGLHLLLQRDADGSSNWDDLLRLGESGGEDAERSVDGADAESGDAAPALAEFSLEGITAQGVNLVWDDRSSGARFELTDGVVQVGAVLPGAPLDLETDFRFRLASPELAGRFKLAGVLAFDLDRQQYASPRLTLAVQAEGPELPGKRAEASLAMEQVRADLGKGTASATAFTLIGYEARVSGSLSARNLLDEPAASGVLELQRCNLRDVLAASGFEVPQTASVDALTSVGATLRFDYDPQRLSLPLLELRLDGQRLQGGGEALLDGSEYALTLRADRLDLDPYLLPKPEPRAGDQTEAGADETASGPAPTALPVGNATQAQAPAWVQTARDLNLRADVAVDELLAGGLRMQGLHLDLQARKGVLAAEPLKLILTRDEDVYRLETGKLFADLHRFGFHTDSFDLAAPGGGVRGTLAASDLLSSPSASGDVSFDHLDLRRLHAALSDLLPVQLPQTADPETFTDLHGSLEFAYSPQRVDVPAFELELDGSSLRGHLRMRSEPEMWDAALTADRIDLDRYLPPEGREGQSPAGNQDPGTGNATESGAAASEDGSGTLLERLRGLSADVAVDVGALRARGLEFTDIQGTLRARDGVLDLEPFALALDKGELQMSWRFDARKQGEHTLSTTIKRLRLGTLLRRFAGVEDTEGTLTLRTIEPLTWSGLDAAGLRTSLTGSVGFAVRDGKYPGLDLFGMLAVVDSLTRAVLEGDEDDSTKFGEVTGTAVARGGVVHCDDLCVKAPGLRAGGQGFVNLGSGEIDYLVRAMGVPDATGQGGASCDEYYGVPMPVRISGTIEEPRYWVSAEEYAASLARGAIGLIGGVVQGGAGALESVVQGGGEAAGEAVQQAGEQAREGGRAVQDAVGGAVEQGQEAVEDFIEGLEDLF